MNRQNKTKDIIYLVILSLILSLSIALTVMLIIGNSRLSRTEKHLLAVSASSSTESTAVETSVQNVINPAKRMYVLGEKDGRLAVFASDGYTVVDMLETYIYSLPLTDREALSAGISVYSVNELVSLIQDYTS